MKNINAHVYIFLFVLFTLLSCKKDSHTIDKTPITIKTLEAGNLQPDQATLYGEIGYLNDETVLDHGFIVFSQGSPERYTISLGDKPSVGIRSHSWKSKFDFGDLYSYIFFVKTDQGTYEAPPSHFTVSNIWADQSQVRYASPGDTLQIKGNFQQVDHNFSLNFTSIFGQKIPFTLNDEKTTLTIILPKAELYHGDRARLNFVRQVGERIASQYLLELRIAARLLPPSPGPHHFINPIKLSAIGLPRYSGNFRIIIGDKILDYSDTYHPTYLGLKGSSYKLGYIWGMDTIYLKETWDFERPNMDLVSLKEKIVHPFGKSLLLGLDYFKYFQNTNYSVHIGSSDGNLSTDQFGESVTLHAQDVPEGVHPVKIKSDVFGDLTIQDKVTVKKLRIDAIDAGEGYYEEPMQITGSFIPDQEYVVRFGDFEIFRGTPKNGSLVFHTSVFFRKGQNRLEIGYLGYNGNFHVAEASHYVQIKGITFDSFYPTKGVPGEIITVKARGLKSNYYRVKIGDKEIAPFKVTDGQLQFILPIMGKKGKTKIALLYHSGVIESEEYFEII
ncbi:IPT/TIG domain-containing protein [Sphingobacterium sp. SYP-B4668]|uniref:IPT/TIG domain-containing protein n=1 Tax=Sphingobacterium sp. SYP-B4668 TaxID=2996035 RepID=UPI0022DD1254|nr:IPT/TIG domain-containing protein [Sphingobacterium sp. SYP-B4668]